MAKMIACKKFFNHHKPIDNTDKERLAIAGGNGAYRQLVRDYGGNPEELNVGVSVNINHEEGMVGGASLLVVGKVKMAPINTRDFWPDAPVPGTVQFDNFDASVFVGGHSYMESVWTADVPWRIRIKEQDGSMVTLLKAQHSDRGFGSLMF